MSLRQALSLLKNLVLPQVIVEMNAKVVVDAILSNMVVASLFAMLIADCIMLGSTMETIVFSFVRRFANTVAHVVAKAACSMTDPVVWEERSPDFLIPTLLSDI